MSHNKNKCSTSHWPHHNTRPRLTHQLILHTSPHLYKFRPFCHSSCEHSTLLITGTHLSIYRWMDMYSMYYLKVSGCMDVSMSLRHGQCTQLTFSHCIHGWKKSMKEDYRKIKGRNACSGVKPKIYKVVWRARLPFGRPQHFLGFRVNLKENQ